MIVNFKKYHGTGNDFIILDNRFGAYTGLTHQQIRAMCHRRFGIGADGLMMLQNAAGFDFEMVYFNADGKPGSMCGNGGRCMVQFAYDCGIHLEQYHFLASDGPHSAEITEQFVRLKMKDVKGVQNDGRSAVLDTGSPHYIVFESDVRKVDVVQLGRAIRYSEEFKNNGINVNFVEQMDDDTIFLRTYERGVEDETMSCGTGATAAALVSAHNDFGFNHVEVDTPGGRLHVEFEKTGKDSFENIWLCGPAKFVFEGSINI